MVMVLMVVKTGVDYGGGGRRHDDGGDGCVDGGCDGGGGNAGGGGVVDCGGDAIWFLLLRITFIGVTVSVVYGGGGYNWQIWGLLEFMSPALLAHRLIEYLRKYCPQP